MAKSRRRLRSQPLLPFTEIRPDHLRIDELRELLRRNLVSFPSQVPTFERHDRPDLQWKIAQLYFVLGWSCEGIARRYGLIHQRVRQILKTWKRRAVEMGYIQRIPHEEILAVAPQTYRQAPSRPPQPVFGLFSPPPAAPGIPTSLHSS